MTAEPRATAVGLDVLARGGNAVDAAVAVALTLAVTHPQAGNLGGGGFLVIRMPDGTATAIDFRERAPKAASRDMYLREDGSVDEDKAQYGAMAAGVPGSPAGLLFALQKYGTSSLKPLVAPAIRYAREGIVVDQFLAGSLAYKAKKLGRYPSTRAVFFADGGERPLRQGELLVQEDLADTLKRFAEGGLAGFYEGETAARIVEQMERDGGIVTARDLTAYAVREREPLRGTYRGFVVLGMPPPSSGGVAVQQMLNMLEPHDLSGAEGAGFGGSRHLHLLTEVMRRAFADRSRWLGDPDAFDVPLAGLVSKEYARERGAGIDLERCSEVGPGTPPGRKEGEDTTHFSIVDKDGAAVSCTTTINSTFGSCLVVEGAGFFLNNEMDDFSSKPGEPNQFGLVGGEANAIAGGKRMLSSMTPTIVVKDDKVRYVLGSPGGGRIISAVLQVVVNLVDHGMGLEQAVAAPRIHHQWLPNEIQWEPLAIVPDVRAALAGKGHAFAAKPRSIGRVQAIEIRPDGQRLAVCDRRSGGSAGAH